MDISLLPSGKRIGKSPVVVDYFKSPVNNCLFYFLSHFHSDHYTGLRKSFPHPIYCSETTANLVSSFIKCRAKSLTMNQEHFLSSGDFSFSVRLVEANHCPGAACFIFSIDNALYFHTGDFRYDRRYHNLGLALDTLYYDNTYAYFIDFPPQKKVIHDLLNRISPPRVLARLETIIYCCSYSVGKERLSLSIAEWMDAKVQVSQRKMNMIRCFSEYTRDMLNSEVLFILDGRRLEQTRCWFSPKKWGTSRDVEEGLSTAQSAYGKGTSVFLSRAPNLLEKAFFVDKDQTLAEIFFEKNDHETPIVTEEKLWEFCSLSTSDSDSHKVMVPTDRFTLEEAPVRVIDMKSVHNIEKLARKTLADKIYVICGSGWNEKTVYKKYTRADGKVVKKGIEIIYVRYSEHTSKNELDEFISSTSYKRRVPTVH